MDALVEITVDDVVIELERCIAEAAGERESGIVDYSIGLTAPEIAGKIGRNVKWVRKQIKKGLSNGTIVLDHAKRINMVRRETTVPVYRPRHEDESRNDEG